MVHEGDAAHLHVTTKNANKLTQHTKIRTTVNASQRCIAEQMQTVSVYKLDAREILHSVQLRPRYY